jgi:hypothetical protein
MYARRKVNDPRKGNIGHLATAISDRDVIQWQNSGKEKKNERGSGCIVTLPRFYREVTDFINQYCRKEYGHSHSHDEGEHLAPQ